jgi:signal transduction histidine kinase
VRLEVRDDGVGFKVPAHLGGWIDANQLGFLGTRARANELGGELEVCLDATGVRDSGLQITP